MREFKTGVPTVFRASYHFRLYAGLNNLRVALVERWSGTGEATFRDVSVLTVHMELMSLVRRCGNDGGEVGDLSTHELFLWMLDRRHFIEWLSAKEVTRGSNTTSLRNSFRMLWCEASSIVRDGARPLRAPPWRSLSEMENGNYRPSLLDTPRRGTDTYLLNKISAIHVASGWGALGPLDMYAAADEILSSNRAYLAPPNALAWLYQSVVAPTLVAPPPNFPYRPKGVPTW